MCVFAFNLTHQGIYFVMPRYKIRLPAPERADEKSPISGSLTRAH